MKPPVIWILGKPNEENSLSRRKFGKCLAEKCGFTYVDMDSELFSRVKVTSKENDALKKRLEGGMGDQIWGAAELRLVNKAWALAKDNQMTLNAEVVLEILKLLLISYHNKGSGFVIDKFPYNVAEADLFNNLFYPPTFAIYIRPYKNPRKS
jgi:hypothetical protein